MKTAFHAAGIALLLHLAVQAPAATSELWGEAGERWSPESRLPDFSFAGYQRGEQAIPNLPVAKSVRDFGAVGDGKHDDTEAFKKAIASVTNATLLVPAGRYVINDILYLRNANFVLRGESPEKSILFFPRPLNDIKPNWGATTEGRRTSNYSWSGGLLSVEGNYRSDELARVVQPARRGAAKLQVEAGTKLRAGQWIEVRQTDLPDNSLAASLYAGQPGSTPKLLGRTRASLTAQIVSLENQQLTLNRALPFDLDPKWKPRLFRFEPTVTNVGIENLGFEFPVTPYQGHFTELGFNPLAFVRAAHCWARQLHFWNADSGIFFAGRFCTVDGVVFDSTRPPDRASKTVGHHGVYISDDDNLFTNFRYNVRMIHDITVSHCSCNVISHGSGVDICLDHHKRAPFANLFTELDLGAGTRLYRCGGGDALGRNSAGWTTFWNLRAATPQSWPPQTFAPDLINIVGLTTRQPTLKDPTGKWFEALPPETLQPQNLHQAQLRRRLSR